MAAEGSGIPIPYPFGMGPNQVPTVSSRELHATFVKWQALASDPTIRGLEYVDSLRDVKMLFLGLFGVNIVVPMVAVLKQWARSIDLREAIRSMWGSDSPRFLVFYVPKIRWRIASDEGSIYLERELVEPAMETVGDARFDFINAVIMATGYDKLSDDGLVDVFLASHRVVWSDCIETLVNIGFASSGVGDDYMVTAKRLLGYGRAEADGLFGRTRKVVDRGEYNRGFMCPAYKQLLEGVGEGSRDNACFGIITMLRALGVPKEELITMMAEWNSKCNPPLGKQLVNYKVTYHMSHNLDPPKCDWVRDNMVAGSSKACNQKCGVRHPLQYYDRMVRRSREVVEE